MLITDRQTDAPFSVSLHIFYLLSPLCASEFCLVSSHRHTVNHIDTQIIMIISKLFVYHFMLTVFLAFLTLPTSIAHSIALFLLSP